MALAGPLAAVGDLEVRPRLVHRHEVARFVLRLCHGEKQDKDRNSYRPGSKSVPPPRLAVSIAREKSKGRVANSGSARDNEQPVDDQADFSEADDNLSVGQREHNQAPNSPLFVHSADDRLDGNRAPEAAVVGGAGVISEHEEVVGWDGDRFR